MSGTAASGRRPRPTAQKIAEGTEERHINRDEPQPADGPITAPEDLSAGALAVWVRLAPDLIDAGVLKAWDRDAFVQCCQCVARLEALRVLIDVEGDVITTTKGERAANPATAAYAKYAATFLSFATRFGLSPSDRGRLVVTPANRTPGGPSPADFFN